AKGGFISTDLYTPFSFMLTLSPKHAIALTVRQRTKLNYNVISTEAANYIDELSEEDDFVIDPNDFFDLSDIYVQAHAWAEVGLTYGRVVMDKDTRFLKAGGTVTLLHGIGSGYTYFNSLRFSGISD